MSMDQGVEPRSPIANDCFSGTFRIVKIIPKQINLRTSQHGLVDTRLLMYENYLMSKKFNFQ